MIRIAKPFLPARTTQEVPQAKSQWSPADRTWIALFVCMVIAVSCGVTVGAAVICAGIGDARAGAAAGGATFGVVLGSLMVWRAMR